MRVAPGALKEPLILARSTRKRRWHMQRCAADGNLADAMLHLRRLRKANPKKTTGRRTGEEHVL